MTALALFNLLKPDYALAEQVAFTDPDIRPEYIHYPLLTATAKCGLIW
jgi:carboxymethylenebutenolidase